MGLEFKVDQNSVDQTLAHIEAVRLRIFANVKAGMQEAMEGLAAEAIDKMLAAGIQVRTGQLLENIGNSPQVRETAQFIKGRVSARREMKIGGRDFVGYVGAAIDEGYKVPALDAKLFQFTEPDASTLFARGHRAFDVKPHPFLLASQQAFEAPIMDIIRARVEASQDEA